MLAPAPGNAREHHPGAGSRCRSRAQEPLDLPCVALSAIALSTDPLSENSAVFDAPDHAVRVRCYLVE